MLSQGGGTSKGSAKGDLTHFAPKSIFFENLGTIFGQNLRYLSIKKDLYF